MSLLDIALRPNRSSLMAEDEESTSLLAQFQAAPFKVAIQKDGALTPLCCKIMRERYNVTLSAKVTTKIPLVVSDDGRIGVVYARNKSICSLVMSGAVDTGIVGTDRISEENVEAEIEEVASFRELGCWSLVLATPAQRGVQNIGQIRRVATQYPTITKAYFSKMGMKNVEIVATNGGTELYPYLRYNNAAIDAVVDLVATGNSLRAHNMIAWTPTIKDIYPVLIRARSAGDYGSV